LLELQKQFEPETGFTWIIRGQEGACGKIPVLTAYEQLQRSKKVELSAVGSAMEAATIVVDDFGFSTVGNQIRLQLSSRLFGSKQ